jgi:hypothetical protein
MTNKIVWEKWVDPFLSNLKDIDATVLDDNEPDEDDEDRYMDSYEKAQRGVRRGASGPVIIGPMGIIPLNEHNTPSKVYCFWMGHTNFSITKRVKAAIERVAGVETLDVFTRYRFRLSIGKAFLSEQDPFGKQVLLAVEQAVNKAPELPVKSKRKQEKVQPKQEGIGAIKKHLGKKFAFWAIVRMPDGTIDTIGATTKEEVLQEADKRNLPPVATSWDKN